MNSQVFAFLNTIFNASGGTAVVDTGYDVFLAAGQSNIDGRNDVTEAPEWITASLDIPKVKVWENAKSQFNVFKLGLNTGSDWNAQTDWAFDMVFYKLYSDYKNKTIYVIKRSKGGTPLYIDSTNVKGTWNTDYASIPSNVPKLSQELETYYNNAVAFAAKYGKTLNIKGMLWYQGGTDVQTTGALAVYKANFIALINRFRTLVGNNTLPFLLLTQSYNSSTYSPTLEQIQFEVQSELPNIFIVDAKDAIMLSDNLHLNAASSIFYGTEAYNQWKNL